MRPIWPSFLEISLLLLIFTFEILHTNGSTFIEDGMARINNTKKWLCSVENDTMRDDGVPLSLNNEDKESEEEDDSEQLDEPPDYG